MPIIPRQDTDLPADNIEFIQYHQPGLIDGDYQIAVRQEIKTTDDRQVPLSTFALDRHFSISSARFILNPNDIYAVFPPAGSLGAHSQVLPHILLNRSTLPWERRAIPLTEDDEKNEEAATAKQKVPWLTLLLFEEPEQPTPQIVTLEQLKNTASYSARFPSFGLETGQQDGDKVTIIDIKKELLQTILPDRNDLELLAHVRQATYFQITDLSLINMRFSGIPDDVIKQLEIIKDREIEGEDNFLDVTNTIIGDEQTDRYRSVILKSAENQSTLAAIVSNRLPQQGGISTVHLVSVEGRYHDGDFDYQGATDADFIRLVSLKSWSFACIDEKQNFKELLKNLNRDPSTLRLPHHPNDRNSEANKYLAMGYIPLPHNLRQGNRTVSWYHGPLIPGVNPTDEIALPVPAADELVRYDPATGLFDISYAAAWQLGRLLALQSKNFSVGLYNWKRAHNQQIEASEQLLIHGHLPFQNQPNVEVPNAIVSWFRLTSLLQGVPFNYLVPDQRILPTESIRFFYVDPLWIDCLLDGAFSIGRVTSSNHKQDRAHTASPANKPHHKVSGCLLRSDVVAGWPSLLVDAWDKDRLKILRMDRLSPNVLICLFDGEVKIVDIHQKPETLHFGLDLPDDKHPSFYKKLRSKEGHQINLEISSIPWKGNDERKRVVNITELANNIQSTIGNPSVFTSAQFASETIAGVEKVRFTIRS